MSENRGVGVNILFPHFIGSGAAPGTVLHLFADAAGTAGLARYIATGKAGSQLNLVYSDGPVNQKIFRVQNASGITSLNIVKDDLTANTVTGAIVIKNLNGNIGLRVTNPTHPLHLASGAHCTAGGGFTSVSSRDAKEDIQPLAARQALETVRALEPVRYRYKSEPEEEYLGFIAEDVPELVASGNRKSLAPLDITAVLTKVVQDQDRQLSEQKQTIDQLTRRLQQLEDLIKAK